MWLARQPVAEAVVPTQAVSFALWPSGQRRTSVLSGAIRQLPGASTSVSVVSPGSVHVVPIMHIRQKLDAFSFR